MSYALTNRRVVLAFGVLLSVACGGMSAPRIAPAKDAAVATLDVLLYSGVKNVTAMVAGPDGNLWLATSDGTIARLTMAGQIDVFPVGLWQSGHTSLARGPDGYLWLGSSDCSECSLARVATDGTITEVPVEDDLRPVQCLTNAPDGSVWFLGGYFHGGGGAQGGLVRVTANGVERAREIVPVDCLDGAYANALAMDPDGNAWVALWGNSCEELLRVAPDGQRTQHLRIKPGFSEVPRHLGHRFRWQCVVPAGGGSLRQHRANEPDRQPFALFDRCIGMVRQRHGPRARRKYLVCGYDVPHQPHHPVRRRQQLCSARRCKDPANRRRAGWQPLARARGRPRRACVSPAVMPAASLAATSPPRRRRCRIRRGRSRRARGRCRRGSSRRRCRG